MTSSSLSDFDLAKCLSGEQQLISWDLVCTALSDPDYASRSIPLRRFLTVEENVDILSRPWNPFTHPSESEKSKFYSKTTPVNIIPGKDEPYSLDEIKEDSLWLSKEANISQYAALRLVVQEWQNRPAFQLLSGLTMEETVSVREAAGFANHGASTFVPNTSILTHRSATDSLTDAQFESLDQRKIRLIGLYHNTCVAILRTSQLLVAWGCAKTLRSKTIYGPDYYVCEDWLEELGRSISVRQNREESNSKTQGALGKAIHGIAAILDVLDNGCEWQTSELLQEEVQNTWVCGRSVELVHLLHISFIHAAYTSTTYLPSATIEEWFKTMSRTTFFREFPAKTNFQLQLVPLIQVLTCLLTTEILKVHLIADDLSSGAYADWNSSMYILDSGVAERITDAFIRTQQDGPGPATVPAFAWAMIMRDLVSCARSLEEDRDRYIEAEPSSSISHPPPHPLESAVLPLNQRFDSSEKSTYQELGEVCIQYGAAQLMTNMIKAAREGYGTVMDRISLDAFRLTFLRVVRTGLASAVLAYCEELVVLMCAILASERLTPSWATTKVARYADPIVSFILEDDAVLQPELIEQTRIRYSLELLPFTLIFSALTRGEKLDYDGLPSFFGKLTGAYTLMQRLPLDFAGYSSVHEDENANSIRLEIDLPQFVKRNGPNIVQDFMIISANTEGVIKDDRTRPMIASWQYSHSILEYLVHLLSTGVVGSNKIEHSSGQPVSLDSAAEIVGFLADLLHLSLHSSRMHDNSSLCSPELLSALNINAEHRMDTASIVLAILDEEMVHLCHNPGNKDSLALLVNCMHFVQSLVAIAPNRIWTWLARSRLLESDGHESSLANILISTEIVHGTFDFLLGCIQLFNTLIDSLVGQSVSRRFSNKSLTRFNASGLTTGGTSDKVLSNILLTFGRTLATIYEESVAWKFQNHEQRQEINISICEGFTAVLKYAYSIDDENKAPERLIKHIVPVADWIRELYLSKSDNDLPINPIIASLLPRINVMKNHLLTNSDVLSKKETTGALQFSEVLVRVALLLGKPWTHLEQQLFRATPLLARLYVVDDNWKAPVARLLETLIRGATRASTDASSNVASKIERTEPPSLLGYLGSRTARAFLDVLSQLDEPMQGAEVQKQIWNLLSAAVTSRQQWFALYLLTGNTSRNRTSHKSTSTQKLSRHTALLNLAVISVARLNLGSNSISWPLYVSVIQFIASAYNNWSWAIGDYSERKDMLKKLLEFFRWIAVQPYEVKTEESIVNRSYQNNFAALAADILAMSLHDARQTGDVTLLKDVVPSLPYLEDNALTPPSYNASLHAMLTQNMAEKFSGLSISSFKRTTLTSTSYGPNFYYDVDLADKLLGFDGRWRGPRSGHGFQGEVIRANLNLGLVESQVQLLEGWKFLAIELSHFLDKDERLSKVMVRVVKQCMESNTRTSFPEALFGQLMFSRADLAYALLRKLVDTKDPSSGARNLVSPIWNAIRSHIADFDEVFSNDSMHYYRELLRILYLALQSHLEDEPGDNSKLRSSFRGAIPKSKDDSTPVISDILLEILSETVVKGFRSLAMQLHAEPASVFPSDFALLNALLQRILAIPEMSKHHAQAALLFANGNTVRYASSLFSWSDRLTLRRNDIDDPIYGELSLLFILSLSSMPTFAETIAVEGILSQLNTANLMNYYRRPNGMGPFDAPARLHSIWTKGILPLCLNLLLSVGAPIASEVSSFLNQYPEQVTRASNSLIPRNLSRITLSMASEIHSLSLIWKIIDEIRKSGPRLGIQGNEVPPLEWDRDNVKEDLDSWMSRQSSLMEKVVYEGTEKVEERVVVELLAAQTCLGANRANGNGNGHG